MGGRDGDGVSGSDGGDGRETYGPWTMIRGHQGPTPARRPPHPPLIIEATIIKYRGPLLILGDYIV